MVAVEVFVATKVYLNVGIHIQQSIASIEQIRTSEEETEYLEYRIGEPPWPSLVTLPHMLNSDEVWTSTSRLSLRSGRGCSRRSHATLI